MQDSMRSVPVKLLSPPSPLFQLMEMDVVVECGPVVVAVVFDNEQQAEGKAVGGGGMFVSDFTAEEAAELWPDDKLNA